MKETPIRGVLAVDIRSRRVGYAVFETTPVRLLDWGMRKKIDRHGRGDAIADLLRMFQPSVVVLRRIKVGGRRDTAGAQNIVHTIRSEARGLSIPVVSLGEAVLKKFFRLYGNRSKYDIASFLTICFPELKWRLPPRRRIWKAEHPRMSIFDSVQLGVAFLVLQNKDETVQKLLSRTQRPFVGPSVT
jgi:hypothetical protein